MILRKLNAAIATIFYGTIYFWAMISVAWRFCLKVKSSINGQFNNER